MQQQHAKRPVAVADTSKPSPEQYRQAVEQQRKAALQAEKTRRIEELRVEKAQRQAAADRRAAEAKAAEQQRQLIETIKQERSKLLVRINRDLHQAVGAHRPALTKLKADILNKDVFSLAVIGEFEILRVAILGSSPLPH